MHKLISVFLIVSISFGHISLTRNSLNVSGSLSWGKAISAISSRIILKEEIVENTKYYLESRKNRYIDYAEANKDLSIEEVVKIVNCNRDWPAYTNIIKTNLKDKKLILANKYYTLNKYYPKNIVRVSRKYGYANRYLQKEAYVAFVKMHKAAAKKGLTLFIISGFRSYSLQSRLYNGYKRAKGLTYTDKWSARAGHSEHQLGLAIDLSNGKTGYTKIYKTKEYKWLKENAHKYGYIERYPKGKEYLTGYGYEPWHYRYVGVHAAAKIYNENITYDEYYAYYVLGK